MSQQACLLTAGYAGHTLDSFLSTLRQHNVEVVIDVRQNPVSRKKGFSRSAFAAFLMANHVAYIHESEFGVPVELRRQLKSGERDMATYLDSFRDYLAERGDALDRLSKLAEQERCCLVCAEHLPGECHRSVVAEAIEDRKGNHLKVIHV